MTALVLLGHGSHLNGNSSAPILEHAAELRRRGNFAKVLTGFWKEEPSLSRCLDGCEDYKVVAVPVFISNGYFTRTVIPREMRLDGPITVRDARRIAYTAPVGADLSLSDVIVERAIEAGAGPNDAIAVLGHGTRRDSESEKNVFAMADRVRSLGKFAEAGAVFLDQEPGMLALLETFASRTVVVVPLFIADGWHVGQTIPEDLALDGAETRRGGRIVRYARPVGTHPSVANVIEKLALQLLLVNEHKLGQLTIDEDGLGVPGPGTELLIINPEALVPHTRIDSLGRYRPLSGARTLPAGWRARFSDGLPAECAINRVYPLALTHQRQLADSALRVVSLEDVLARQSGRYQDVGSLPEAGRRLALQTVCGECVRRPVWDGASCAPHEIPCPEPCSVLVAFCREAALWQADRPSPAPPDPAVAWAAFDMPGNELREAYLRESSHLDD